MGFITTSITSLRNGRYCSAQGRRHFLNSLTVMPRVKFRTALAPYDKFANMGLGNSTFWPDAAGGEKARRIRVLLDAAASDEQNAASGHSATSTSPLQLSS